MLMKYLAVAVLALGAGIVAWMGSTFMVANTLALLVIVAIALCYLAGIVELVRFHRDTTRLASALSHLSQTGVDLDQWRSEERRVGEEGGSERGGGGGGRGV